MRKRVRIFAGPNGSGKSTIKSIVEDRVLLGTYVNADEIKVLLEKTHMLDFSAYGIIVSPDHVMNSLKHSTWTDIIDDVGSLFKKIYFRDNRLVIDKSIIIDDYFVSFMASYLWERLLENSNKFTVETVMSHPSKLHFIERAKSQGFKVYLYFVSLASPALNKRRVQTRVQQGGHDVDEEKIEKRYYRTMDNLLPALRLVDSAYLFDNSAGEPNLFAVKEDGVLTVQGDYAPKWFNTYFIDKL